MNSSHESTVRTDSAASFPDSPEIAADATPRPSLSSFLNSPRVNRILVVGVLLISLIQLLYMVKTDINLRRHDFERVRSDYAVVMIITYSFLLFSIVLVLLFGLKRISVAEFPIGTGGTRLSMRRRAKRVDPVEIVDEATMADEHAAAHEQGEAAF